MVYFLTLVCNILSEQKQSKAFVLKRFSSVISCSETSDAMIISYPISFARLIARLFVTPPSMYSLLSILYGEKTVGILKLARIASAMSPFSKITFVAVAIKDLNARR